MAPVTSVVVLTTHGRRVNIKVQADTTLMKVLEDVCKKFEFNVEEFDLKHHNKVLDLSMQIRYAGLPNNAGLEMCAAVKKRSESNVMVMVQVEDGSRLTGHFVPSDSVWQVVFTLCGNEVSNMENPVIIYTRTEISGVEKMKEMSLRSIGLTGGRALFRLLNRTEQQLRMQANVSAPIPKLPRPPSPEVGNKTVSVSSKLKASLEAPKADNSAEPQAGTSAEPQAGTSEPVPGPSWASGSPPPKKPMHEAIKTQDNIEPMEIDKAQSDRQQEQDKQVEKELILLGERNAVVFNRLCKDPRLTQEEELPADFFELTLEDAKRLMRDLRRKREEMESQPIKTASMRQLEENRHQLSMLQKYKHTVLRVYFQDGIVLQAAFRPVESVDAVYSFVRSYLREPDHSFELYTTPPKRVLQSEDRLIEIGCVPAAILHFSSSQNAETYLQPQLIEQMSSPAAAQLAAKRSKNS